MPHRATPLILLTLLVVPLAAGCTSWRPADAPALALGAQGEMVHLTDRTPMGNDAAICDEHTHGVHLFAAANEVVSFQLLVEPGPAAARDIRLSAEALAGPGGAKIEATNIVGFRMMPVKVTQYPPWYLRLVNVVPEPANFYDALVPMGAGAAVSLGAGERLAACGWTFRCREPLQRGNTRAA